LYRTPPLRTAQSPELPACPGVKLPLASFRFCTRISTWLKLLVISLAVLSLLLVAAEDLLADHCGDHDCDGTTDSGDACHGCLCCCPLANMLAVVSSVAGSVQPPVGWALLSTTVPVENNHFARIDRPPRNSR